MSYFVLDISSGLHDGFYSSLEWAKGSLEYLKKEYPEIPWMICQVVVPAEDKQLFYAATDKTFHARATNKPLTTNEPD